MQSNQAAEIYAIEEAVRRTDDTAPLHIVSDSRFAVDGLTVYLSAWEDNGWLGVKCAELFRRATARLRARGATTTLRWVKGHSGVLGNEEADTLAKKGLDGLEEEMPEIAENLRPFLHSGMRVEMITQSKAYRAIREIRAKEQRPTTTVMIGRIQATLAEDYDVAPTETRVWLGIRDKDFSRKLRQFLWKSAHDAHRVGKYWRNIRGFEERAVCSMCGTEDSLEHILLECDAAEVATIWSMYSTLRTAGVTPKQMSLGAIIGAAHIVYRNGEGKAMRGVSRLAKLLVTEAAHCIWRMRCERVIQWEGTDRTHSPVEAKARFWSAVNRRMLVDRDLVCSRIPGKRSKRALVTDTWRRILQDAENLPEDWVVVPGVLVGKMGQLREAGIG
ncbi:hypothetical protein K466DRAFT_552795 [Polyporus arcularius HHB13444]|uniref:ribonuclease H n=1 Tax=Polyporus arcularius HHB13444 TaxID=1314778 RepID=A0A5C3P7J9_9APHY|nr:hypothetical protein K466DRAFT_552795 [Polyporus arcularius HHB13444]